MGQTTYERPPLNEVTFGLHFGPLTGLRSAHYGLFWSRVRSDFIEALDKPVVGEIIATAAEPWFPLPRVWLVHRDQQQLLQIQPNRFYFNWRRGDAGTPYPRFHVLEPQFQRFIQTWGSFVADESLGPFDIKAFELAYTNHIFQGEGWDTIVNVGKVFPDIAWRAGPSRREPKAIAWHAVFDGPAMRISADVKSATTVGSPARSLLAFELRAQSNHTTPPKLDEMHDWLCKANEEIVRAFEDLTDERIQHEVWKRVSS